MIKTVTAMRNNSILLCMIILIGTQLVLGAQFNNDKLGLYEANRNSQNRMLKQTMRCTTETCSEFGGYLTESASYEIILYGGSEITLEVEVGQSEQELLFALETFPRTSVETKILLSSISSTANKGILSQEGSFWTRKATIDANYGSRSLKIIIENESYQITKINLEITKSIVSPEDTTSSSWLTVDFPSWLGPVIAVGGFFAVLLIICCIIRRIRRNRLLRRRLRSRAAYELERANQERNAAVIYQPVVYQPVYQQVHQPPQNYQQIPQPPQNYQQIAPPMHILLPNNPNLPLAPPMQLVIADPNNGLLSELNFDHRFPEASFERFRSSFPQKTCSICLEDLKKTQACRQLYCKHIFHTECAKLWLLNQMKKQNHAFCPNCNKDMTFVLERAKGN